MWLLVSIDLLVSCSDVLNFQFHCLLLARHICLFRLTILVLSILATFKLKLSLNLFSYLNGKAELLLVCSKKKILIIAGKMETFFFLAKLSMLSLDANLS